MRAALVAMLMVLSLSSQAGELDFHDLELRQLRQDFERERSTMRLEQDLARIRLEEARDQQRLEANLLQQQIDDERYRRDFQQRFGR